MTDYCNPIYDTPYFHLYFNSITLVNSSRLLEYKPTWRRLTEINKRQNFFSPEVILEGRYPALYLEHEFTLFTEAADRASYTARFYNIPRSFVSGTASPLSINHPQYPGVAVIHFGDCFIEGSLQDNPNSLLQYEAGIMRVRFIGTTIPSVYYPPSSIPGGTVELELLTEDSLYALISEGGDLLVTEG